MDGLLVFLFALSLSSRLCFAQSSWVASDDFRQLVWHSSIAIGEYVYIVGGEMWIIADNQYVNTAQNQTIAVPLKTSWTNSTVQLQATNLPSSFPYMKSPTLWLDQSSNLVWFFNGETSYITPIDADPLSVWAFSPDMNGSGTWKENNSPTDNIFNNLTRSYGCGSTYSPTAGYCLGGYASAHTTPTYDGSGSTLSLDGMQVFDFADRSWSNSSSVGSSANGWNMWPVFQYVPAYGRSGIIVMVGGYTPMVQDDGNDASGQESMRPMSNVTVYDIYNQQWYSQTATGDVPMGRFAPCFVGAQGVENNTYEIFVFGGTVGMQGSTNSDSHQVYVLSLPAFRWFRAIESTSPRYGHTCNVIGNRQMLSIGGLDPIAGNASTPDPFIYGLGIFDMTEWTWTSGYVADAKPYEPSSQVSQFYSTNSHYPSWDNPALQALIEANSTTPTTTPASTTGTSSPISSTSSASSSTTTSSSNSSSTPAGAIAGGVVGGIAFLALVGAGTWVFMRRRRLSRSDLQPTKLPTEMAVDTLPAELVQNPAELGPDLRHEMGGPGFHPLELAT